MTVFQSPLLYGLPTGHLSMGQAKSHPVTVYVVRDVVYSYGSAIDVSWDCLGLGNGPQATQAGSSVWVARPRRNLKAATYTVCATHPAAQARFWLAGSGCADCRLLLSLPLRRMIGERGGLKHEIGIEAPDACLCPGLACLPISVLVHEISRRSRPGRTR